MTINIALITPHAHTSIHTIHANTFIYILLSFILLFNYIGNFGFLSPSSILRGKKPSLKNKFKKKEINGKEKKTYKQIVNEIKAFQLSPISFKKPNGHI